MMKPVSAQRIRDIRNELECGLIRAKEIATRERLRAAIDEMSTKEDAQEILHELVNLILGAR